MNRLWQEFFGIGIVKTSEDFGIQSEVPVHRELMDWLAAEFMDSGWDFKYLVRTIVTSDTYRQTSRVTPELYERDPKNRLLARGPRFRLPFWMIRDSALTSSGLLTEKVGGEPVHPYQPTGVWEEMSFGQKKYRQDKGDKLYRRSLYTFWRRIVMPTMFFDNSNRMLCEVNPLRTNTPLHALFTLNDPIFVESSRHLATRAIKTSPDLDQQLSFASQKLLSRPPEPEELTILRNSYRDALAAYTEDQSQATAVLAVGESPVDSSIPPLQLAALTTTCLTLFNTDESLTKE